MSLRIHLHFVGIDRPALDHVEFWHPSEKELYLSVRGKTSGAYETDRTFQWTNAVQAVAILFLRMAIVQTDKAIDIRSPRSASLEGVKGSIAASLDYALDKQPAWLTDMFGFGHGGRAYFKNLITRSNPGLRREGNIRIGLKTEEFETNNIEIFWNSNKPVENKKIILLLRNLEKAKGFTNSRENTESLDGSIAIPARLLIRTSPQTDIFKTPLLEQDVAGASAHVRCYEQDRQGALVVSFVPYEEFHRQKRVLIRIHSSCAPSEALGTIDCDCKSQLDSAILILKVQKGILIYLDQEGRGAGLFSKYQGMSISSRTGVDTYEAYRKMSLSRDLRTYGLVIKILQDLGISQITLLTNNPDKTKELVEAGLDVETQSCLGQLTPQNLSYLYSKMVNGSHDLRKLLIPDSRPLYILKSSQINIDSRNIWIFAGDDTLWEDNLIYEDIIRLFIDHISRHVTFPRDHIRRKLDEVEIETISSMGYGGPGFLESLKKTLKVVSNESSTSIPEPSELFSAVIPRLNSIAIEISFRTIDVLRRIRKQGDGLVLFVQGPFEQQMRKIAQSNLGEFFHAIALTPEKNSSRLSELVQQLGFSGKTHVIVGSSLQADIAPAITLGLKSFYYNNPNSWQLLNSSELNLTGYEEISQLEEVLTRPVP